MKALMILLVSSVPAWATPMACASIPNKEFLSFLEKNSKETLRFVGIQDGTNSPVEITVSDEGTWTLIILVPSYGSCILAVGTNWQATEQTKGVEN